MHIGITPDDEYIKTEKVPGPTKEEIRTIVLSKLHIQEDDTIVDVGCGTGGLTVEFAKRCKKVYSIDVNVDAINTTKANLEKFNLSSNVEVLEEDGASALEHIDGFTRVMIGGSGGNLKDIIRIGYDKLPVGGRLVTTSIVLETATDSVEVLKELGASVEVVTLNVSRGIILKRGVMMKALNPITIVSATKV